MQILPLDFVSNIVFSSSTKSFYSSIFCSSEVRALEDYIEDTVMLQYNKRKNKLLRLLICETFLQCNRYVLLIQFLFENNGSIVKD